MSTARNALKRIARRLVPELFAMSDRVAALESQLHDLAADLTTGDTIDELRTLVARVEPYQPIYNLPDIIAEPKRETRERCEAIEAAIGPVRGKRILDIGSSLGYLCFYFQDRNARAEGWDYDAANILVARKAAKITGISPGFYVKELNLETLKDLPSNQFDLVIVLSVFHHIIHARGLDYVQRLVRELLDKTPCLFVELAKRGEDPTLVWDKSQPVDELAIFQLVRDSVDIKKIGDFHNHLSDKTRPLYMVSTKKTVEVGSRRYSYHVASNEAYERSPMTMMQVRRRYYYSDEYVIKEYSTDGENAEENVGQMLSEIVVYLNVLRKTKVFHAPVLVDYDIGADYIKVVLERIDGTLVSETTKGRAAGSVERLLTDTLRTLADLRRLGLNHNDVRSWNIIVNQEGFFLIDYGLASATTVGSDLVDLLWAAHAYVTGERESAIVGRKDLPPRKSFDKHRLAGIYDAIAEGETDPSRILSLIGARPEEVS